MKQSFQTLDNRQDRLVIPMNVSVNYLERISRYQCRDGKPRLSIAVSLG